MIDAGFTRDRADRWARAAGIALAWTSEGPRARDFRTDPSLDFGRTIQRVPLATVAPIDEAQLAEALRFLRETGTRYVLRGSGHSSGGQALIDGGVVVDLGGLAGIVADDPEGETITVRGGTHWLQLCEHLARQGRRPPCLTTNAASSVAGTLAVGGFGDTTHLHGLQTAGVTSLRLVTPDGACHGLDERDELFRYALAGRGQLGAISEVTLRTVRGSSRLAVRRFEWATLDRFLRDALVMTALRAYDFMRVRMFWTERHAIQGFCGRFVEERPAEEEPAIAMLAADGWTTYGQTDLLEDLRVDVSAGWTYACPAVELVFPLPELLQRWDAVNAHLHRTGITRFLRHGAALVLVPRQALPLAPVPEVPYSLMVAFRPMVPPAEAAAIAPAMRDLAALGIDLGARLYLMSVEPDLARIRTSVGPAWDRWVSLKRAVDPDGLCNPGLLAA